MILVLLGAPGSGKGSVGKPLSVYLGIPVISTGEIFRSHIREKTTLGLKAKQYIDEGTLVPDEVTLEIVEDRICRQDCQSGFILDGFPRTIIQAERFEKMLKKEGISLDFVLNIELSDEIIVRRISNRRVCISCGEDFNCVTRKPSRMGICDECGSEIVQRADDSEETVKKRLETYYKQTEPLVEYYRSLGILRSMNNDCSIEEGFRRAKAIVDEYLRTQPG
jgi:adenylate kinase